MKKIIYFAVVCMALAACVKTEPKEEIQQSGNAFVKGQDVTLTVSSPGGTKVTSEADASTGTVSFKWEIGDSIVVSVGKDSAVFITDKLVNDGKSAQFKGKMPSGGNTFNVQFPVKEPDLEEQSYSENEAIPHNMMLFKATDCSVDKNFSLTAVNSSLRLNIWSKNQTVGKIVVTDTDNTLTYTLNVSGGKAVGATEGEATPFFVVVPAGTYNFTAEVFDNDDTPESISKFQTTAAKTFVAGQILYMAQKDVPHYSGGDQINAR